MANDHQLPEIDEQASLGARLVRHAVGTTLVAVGVIAAVGLVVLFTFRFEVTVEASGVLEPERVWRVHSTTAGLVSEVLVATGETVAEGQLLALLDGFELENRLARLRLELRFKRSNPQVPRSETEYLEEEIRTVERQQERLRIVSSGSGVVLTEDLDLLPGSRVNQGDLLFEVVSPGQWKVELLVPEMEIYPIRIGDPVKIRVPAMTAVSSWTTETFPGAVTFVGSDPAQGPAGGRGSYRVFAALDSQRIQPEQLAQFKRGMTVEGRVITRSARAIDLLVRHLRRRLGLDR